MAAEIKSFPSAVSLLSVDEIVLLAFNKLQLAGNGARIFESCLLSHQHSSVSIYCLCWSFSQLASFHVRAHLSCTLGPRDSI